jgi:hypothetical protein
MPGAEGAGFEGTPGADGTVVEGKPGADGGGVEGNPGAEAGFVDGKPGALGCVIAPCTCATAQSPVPAIINTPAARQKIARLTP